MGRAKRSNQAGEAPDSNKQVERIRLTTLADLAEPHLVSADTNSDRGVAADLGTANP